VQRPLPRRNVVKIAKRIAIALCVYVGIVFTFESMIGFFQPANASTLVIATTDAQGESKDRVLARLESAGKLYVAANHWPRAWYNQALANPAVQVTFNDETTAYTAVPVTGAEHNQVNADNDTGIAFKVLTGFPPRKFLRLDPIAAP